MDCETGNSIRSVQNKEQIMDFMSTEYKNWF
jgi:hypothetical protein